MLLGNQHQAAHATPVEILTSAALPLLLRECLRRCAPWPRKLSYSQGRVRSALNLRSSRACCKRSLRRDTCRGGWCGFLRARCVRGVRSPVCTCAHFLPQFVLMTVRATRAFVEFGLVPATVKPTEWSEEDMDFVI